jgi:hypothetical protein
MPTPPSRCFALVDLRREVGVLEGELEGLTAGNSALLGVPARRVRERQAGRTSAQV